jgi:hypothetical protein
MRGRERCLIAILALGSACNRSDEFDVDVEPIELDVDVRLEAVMSFDGYERFYAVGSGGLVIDHDGNRWELPASLHDVIVVEGDYDIGGEPVADSRLIVVGDDGYVAVARHPYEGELEFEIEDIGTDANLRAIAADRSPGFQAVIVGDDTLVVGRENQQGELVWTHPVPPLDGWGMLRDVSLDGVCAVGEAGRMVCMREGEPDQWEVIELDTDVNLNSFCAYHHRDVVGDDGVIVTSGNDGWEAVQFEPRVDMLACTLIWVDSVIVGADKTIYWINFDRELEPLLELDWQPRALDPVFGYVLVGDKGRAGYLYQSEGFILH